MARLGPGAPADLSVGYSSLLETSYAGAVAYARPWGRGAFAAGFVHFSQSALTAYDGRGDAAGSFTPSDQAFSAAYAARVGETRCGGALKLIRQSLADVSATGIAADLGVQARSVATAGEGPLDLGASLTNLGPPIKLGGEKAPLPLALRGGVLWHTSPTFGAALDVNLPADAAPYVSLGFEWDWLLSVGGRRAASSPKASVRAGYNQGRARDHEGLAGLSAGAGLDLASFRLDYAWVPFGDLGTTNRVSLAFRF